MAVLIVASTAVAVLDSEPALAHRLGQAFAAAEMGFQVAFAVEYALRLWTAPDANVAAPAWRSRLRFALSPAGLADLAALASFALGGSSGFLLRLVRLIRIFRLAKLGRMTRALDHLRDAVLSRRDELLLSLAAGGVLVLTSATALYLTEGGVQPQAFGSIPRALWWSITTATTIGYGDVYPITPLGKALAAASAIGGIGVIALPTGILAAAFSDALKRGRGPGAQDGCWRASGANPPSPGDLNPPSSRT